MPTPPSAPPDPTPDPITLDGRTLEGGGQLLRLALCLAAMTSTPVRIHSIRGHRAGGGGLKPQHLACATWLAHACDATVSGAAKGSKELLFIPRAPRGALPPVFRKVKVTASGAEKAREVWEARLDIKTAGSTGLALQAVLPFLLFTQFPSPLPIRLTLTGGTNVSQSPSYEYIAQVLLPTLERIGLPRVEATLGKRGWSQGGSAIGSIVLDIPARSSIVLPGFELMPPPSAGEKPKPRLDRLRATFIAPSACHEHFLASLKQNLKSHFPFSAHGTTFTEAHGNLAATLEDSRHSKRMYFLLVGSVSFPTSPSPSNPTPTDDDTANPATPLLLARDWLYDAKLPQQTPPNSHSAATSTLTARVCADLAAEIASGACVDEHMRDQLVVFQALAKGRSRVFGGDGREASLHARTAEWVVQRMLQGVEFDGVVGCWGLGFGVAPEQDSGEGGQGGEADAVGELRDAVQDLQVA